MKFNTGVAITLLTKKWVDTHGLTMKKKVAEYILGTNSTSIKIVSMNIMTLLLAPTLELDVANIAICSGDLDQGFLGCNLLCRYNEVLGTATITLPGLDYLGAVSWL